MALGLGTLAGLTSGALGQGEDSKAIPSSSAAQSRTSSADYFDSRRNGDSGNSGNLSVTLPPMSTAPRVGSSLTSGGGDSMLYLIGAGAVFALLLIAARKV